MIITNQKQARETKHVDGGMFLCGDCGQVKPVHTEGGTGYGYAEDKPDAKPICYECCGKREAQAMRDTGKAALYLVKAANGSCTVGNWSDTLSFRGGYRRGRHNIAGTRYDVWFTFEGFQWHGVTYGDNTQVCHCKRTKERV